MEEKTIKITNLEDYTKVIGLIFKLSDRDQSRIQMLIELIQENDFTYKHNNMQINLFDKQIKDIMYKLWDFTSQGSFYNYVSKLKSKGILIPIVLDNKINTLAINQDIFPKSWRIIYEQKDK